MTPNSKEHYEFVLQEARSELARIHDAYVELQERQHEAETAVRFLEEMVRKTGGPASPPLAVGRTPEEPAPSGGAYIGLTLLDAVVKVLDDARTLMDTRSICDALEEGGFESKAKDLYNNVYGTLFNTVKRDDSPIEKIDKLWGLKSWKLRDQVSAEDSVEGSLPWKG